MMEERQRAKPRARATWLVMQLQFWGSPRKTMEQRKVTTSEKSSEKVNRGSLAFTRGVPRFKINTTWEIKTRQVNKPFLASQSAPSGAFSLSHPDCDGDESSEGRDDYESDPKGLSKGQELDDFWHTGIMGIV